MHTAVTETIFAHRCAFGVYTDTTSMTKKKKNPAAVALGRKGGKNSRVNLSQDEKTALAKKAASARWGNAAMKKPGKVAAKGTEQSLREAIAK